VASIDADAQVRVAHLALEPRLRAKHVVGADGMMHVRALPAVKYDQPAARIWPHDVMLSLDAPRQKRNVECVTPHLLLADVVWVGCG
jgi:hypothetical protein